VLPHFRVSKSRRILLTLCGHFKRGSIELGNLRELFRSRFLRRRVSERLDRILYYCYGKKYTKLYLYYERIDALEVKWRDATTDGDHITKEHTRVKVIQSYGYKPIRVMFYYPQREQAIKIQETLKTLYSGVSGEYYAGDDAWDFMEKYTKIDLKKILSDIADERTP
jgi:hypothetical protein